MSTVLVTFPGRAGDLLWALPTVRAISESLGHPVDLQIAGEFESMVDLLLQQPYLAGVIPDPRWSMSDGWEAPRLPREYNRVIHLGYRRWPELALPLEVYANAISYFADNPPTLPSLDLNRPWITVDPGKRNGVRRELAFGWTDCHFELKYGLTDLLFTAHRHDHRSIAKWDAEDCLPPGSRWETEAGYLGCGWLGAARRISRAKVFLGDCSALHVLACALGKPVVCYEPMEARWNPIFYPYGKVGPQVTLVVGNDGQPTQDARHTAETLEKVLNGR